MQHATSHLSPLELIQKTFMIIGALLFIGVSSVTIMQTGTPSAAHDTHDLQPELRATAVFSR